jgi:hypothetical protein
VSLRVQFANASGPLKILREEVFGTMSAARAAVEAHAATLGCTNVRVVEDVDSLRFTARTPGGRGGRNIAFADYEVGL